MLALGAALVLAQNLSGDDSPDSSTKALASNVPNPGSADGEGVDPDAGLSVDECRLKVVKAVIAIDPKLRDSLAARSVAIQATTPATLADDGLIELTPRVSVDVTCDLRSGVIGLRGGVMLTNGESGVDIRRWRIAAPSGRIEAYLSAVTPVPTYSLHTPLKGAKRKRMGTTETIGLPVRIAEGAAAVMNHDFGTAIRHRETKLGTLRLTVERITPAT